MGNGPALWATLSLVTKMAASSFRCKLEGARDTASDRVQLVQALRSGISISLNEAMACWATTAWSEALGACATLAAGKDDNLIDELRCVVTGLFGKIIEGGIQQHKHSKPKHTSVELGPGIVHGPGIGPRQKQPASAINNVFSSAV